MVTLEQFGRHWWTELSKRVKRGVVFLDPASSECLHWNGGLRLLRHATAVKELSSFADHKDCKKAVFVVSGPLCGITLDQIRDVVNNSSFENVSLVSNASPAVLKVREYLYAYTDNLKRIRKLVKNKTYVYFSAEIRILKS